MTADATLGTQVCSHRGVSLGLQSYTILSVRGVLSSRRLWEWSMTADLTMTADATLGTQVCSHRGVSLGLQSYTILSVHYDSRCHTQHTSLQSMTADLTADLVDDCRLVNCERRRLSVRSTGEYTTLLCNWRISYKSPVTLLSHLQIRHIFLSHVRMRRVTHMNESCVTLSNDVVTTLVRDYTNRFAVG